MFKKNVLESDIPDVSDNIYQNPDMLNFIVAKYYEKEVDANEEHPLIRTYVYASITLMFLFFSITLVGFTLVENLAIKFDFYLNSKVELIAQIILSVVFAPFLAFWLFIRKLRVQLLANKFYHKKISKFSLYILLFFIPLFSFLIGPIMDTVLFGGTMCSYEFAGILKPYFLP